MLSGATLRDADRDYLTRALQVVSPTRDLPVALPAGRRDRYPADPTALSALLQGSGVDGSCARLVAALSALP
jgi:hypothetical protein